MQESSNNNLESWIKKLIERPIYNCLKIISKGNVLYILKDKDRKLYILFIPNVPLDDKLSLQLKNLGYKEKFAKINFSKFVDYEQSESINIFCSEIDFIFKNIFQVESTRHWRFEIESGMRLLKDLVPLITKSDVRIRNKKKRFKWYNRWKLDLLISLFAGCLAGITVIGEKIFPRLNYFIIILLCCLIFLILLRLLTLSQRYFTKYGKERLFSNKRLEFFYSHGFKRAGHRFTTRIKGFKTDIYYNGFGEIEIAIHHNEVPWEKVIKLSKLSRSFYKYPKIIWRQYASKKRIKSRSNIKILEETEIFIEKLIEFEITPKQL